MTTTIPFPRFPLDVRPDQGWLVIGEVEPRNRLLASIIVHNCPMHLEAVRVEPPGDDGIRYASDPELDEWLDHASAISGDGNFETATIIIRGAPGDYVLIATSYAR